MSDRMPETVSVIIPTYNRIVLVCKAIESCLDQAGCQIEVIVVDDGSTEPVEAVLRENFADWMEEGTWPSRLHRLLYVRQDRQGACVARNTGLMRSSGEYVKFLDSDDALLPGTLARELEAARISTADALLTGWETRYFDKTGAEIPGKRRVIPSPDLRNGIDDMLLGRAPWTSAALYRHAFITNLRWDPAWSKAQDWGWALTVCLAGARFVSLDIPSSVYCHHFGERITSQPGRVQQSTVARQYFLHMIENRLLEQDRLTEDRRRKLAQYYYRDCQMICQVSAQAWRELWKHCQELAPGFTPHESGKAAWLFVRCLGACQGIRFYVFAKSLFAWLWHWKRERAQ